MTHPRRKRQRRPYRKGEDRHVVARSYPRPIDAKLYAEAALLFLSAQAAENGQPVPAHLARLHKLSDIRPGNQLGDARA